MSERERASPTAVSTDFLTTSVLTTVTGIIHCVAGIFFSPQYCFPSKKCKDPPNNCRPDCCNVDIAQVQPYLARQPFSPLDLQGRECCIINTKKIQKQRWEMTIY